MTHRPRFWSLAGIAVLIASVQPKLEPVHVALPLGNDLGSVNGKLRMLHAHGLNVGHLISEQRHVLHAGIPARLVLAQRVQAHAKAFAWVHPVMMNPRRLLRQGGESDVLLALAVGEPS